MGENESSVLSAQKQSGRGIKMFNIWNLPFELQMKKKLFVKIGLIKFFFPVNYYSSFFQLLPPCCLFRKFYSTVSNYCLFIKTSNNDKKKSYNLFFLYKYRIMFVRRFLFAIFPNEILDWWFAESTKAAKIYIYFYYIYQVWKFCMNRKTEKCSWVWMILWYFI